MTEELTSIVLEHLRHIRRKVDQTAEDVLDLKLRVADLEHNAAYSSVTSARQQQSLDKIGERLERIERRLDIVE